MRTLMLCAVIAYIFGIAGCFRHNFTGERTRKFYGYASWYDEEDNGDATASMEKFDPEKFTAAHRRLPLGTHVKVTRIDSGESVIVRINDRGPYKWKRIIDLTPAAARKLDMLEVGITRVCVQVVGKDPPVKD